MSSHRLAFLIYDNRSGSTLFAALLNRHRGVAVLPENNFVNWLFRLHREGFETMQELQSALQAMHRRTEFSQLGVDASAAYLELQELPAPIHVGQVIRVLLGLYFRTTDPHASTWVIKTPGMYEMLREMHVVFPGAKCIHILRDGRAVFHSKRNTVSSNTLRPMTAGAAHAAWTWRKKLRIVERDCPSAMTIRYEDLVHEPEAVMAQALSLLEVPDADRGITKSQRDFAERMNPAHAHVHVNIALNPLKSRTENWRQGLSRGALERYEAICADELRQYGYEPVMGSMRGPRRLRVMGAIAADAVVSAARLAIWRFQRNRRRLTERHA